MALLNPPGQLPSVARIIYRYLLHVAGSKGETKDRLDQLLAPRTLVSDENAAFKDTLLMCKSIGLVQEADGVVRLNPELPEPARNRETGERELPRTVRGLVLAKERNDDLWKDTSDARDLTRALCWFLTQDIYHAPGRWKEGEGVPTVQEAQRADLRRADFVFSNDTRWGAFTRWAPFLGLAWRHGLDHNGQMRGILLPDPTEAVRDTVLALEARERWDAGEFISELARELPVIDGGTYRVEFEERTERSNRPQDTLSSSLSHALLRLDAEGMLTLRGESDIDALTLTGVEGAPVRAVSHITVRVR